MKKKNLILSLICSIILTITLVSFTIVGVVSPNKQTNNGGNNAGNVSIEDPITQPDINENADGSVENPYYIYSAETFNTLVSEHGTENAYFELSEDIDFAGVDFVPMFAKGEAFNGHINGNGYTLRNISINISKENLSNVIFASEKDQNRYNAHIAVFGNIENAEILDVNFENLSVAVDAEVYDHLNNLSDLFAIEEGSSMNEITVGTVAAVAKNSTIKANVEAVVNADAYAIYAKDYVQGYNAVGGVVGVAFDNSSIEGTVNVSINAENGVHYFVGGVAGYAYNTKIANMNVTLTLNGRYDQVLYVGGVAGYGKAVEVLDSNVDLTVKETGDRMSTVGVSAIDDSKFTWVAGVVNVIRANDASELSTIKNVKVVADVDMDAIFAGAVVEIRSTDKEFTYSNIFVTISDVIVDANVNTLKAFGLVKYGTHTNISMNATEVDVEGEYEFNVRLTGNVLLNDSDSDTVASLFFVNNSSNGNIYFTVDGGFKTVKVVVSNLIYMQVEDIETIRLYTKLVVA